LKIEDHKCSDFAQASKVLECLKHEDGQRWWE